MAIAHVYGHDITAPGTAADILMILAGGSAMEALKKRGMKDGTEITRHRAGKS